MLEVGSHYTTTLTPFYNTCSLTLSSLPYYFSNNYPLLFTIKLTLLMFFLILIRGGVPRYRYDFLTKIG